MDERDLRVTRRLDKVDTGMNTIINQLVPVNAVLLFKVGVKAALDVVDDGFPADGGVSYGFFVGVLNCALYV